MRHLYKCQHKECEHEFEFFHHPKDEPAYCEECGSFNVERVFAPKVSHVLKGTGWARDRYQTKKIK
jgi:predicted nucleic acid-binding Zn ribbon protein